MFEVSVADDVLVAQPNGVSEFPGVFSGWLGPVRFLVAPLEPSGGDLQRLATAAQAAAERFWTVTDEGVELSRSSAERDASVPNEVFGPLLFEDGVIVGASTSDEITPAQAATLLRIVLGELHSRRISARVSCPPEGVDTSNLPHWPVAVDSRADVAPDGNSDSEKRWFVRRTVRSVTTTGETYEDVEWLLPDGTWAREITGAVSFDDTAQSREETYDLVIRLRDEAIEAGPDLRLGAVTAVLTSANEERQRHLPPDSIRDHGHVWAEPTAES